MNRYKLIHRAQVYRQMPDAFFRLPPIGEWFPMVGEYFTEPEASLAARNVAQRCADALILVEHMNSRRGPSNVYRLWGYRMTDEDFKAAAQGNWPMPDWAKEGAKA